MGAKRRAIRLYLGLKKKKSSVSNLPQGPAASLEEVSGSLGEFAPGRLGVRSRIPPSCFAHRRGGFYTQR